MEKLGLVKLWSEQKVNIIGWGVILLVVVALAVVAVNGQKQVEVKANSILVQRSDDYVRGNPNSAVKLIEFGDFQCPACKAYESVTAELVAKKGKDFALIFRHMPLTSIHQSALIGAMAAEAAGTQGKFWEMHDILYAKQDEWSQRSVSDPTTYFVQYAKSLNLDIAKFQSDLASSAIRDRILAQRNEADSIGVDATPTFYLNGQKISAYDIQGFTDAINKAAVSSTSSKAGASSSGTSSAKSTKK